MSRLTPRERRREKNKQAILEAAYNLVTETGADGVSMREIARRIDYSPAALYEYFDSKEDIIKSLCTFGFGRLALELSRVSADIPPRERVIELGMTYLEFARKNPEFYLLIVNNIPSGLTSLEELDSPDSPYQLLLQAIRDGIRDGVFTPRKDFGLQEMTYSCWAFVHGMAMLGLTQLKDFRADLDPINRLALEKYLNAL